MFRFTTGRIAATFLLLSTTALPQTGSAASYLDIAPRGTNTNLITTNPCLSFQTDAVSKRVFR